VKVNQSQTESSIKETEFSLQKNETLNTETQNSEENDIASHRAIQLSQKDGSFRYDISTKDSSRINNSGKVVASSDSGVVEGSTSTETELQHSDSRSSSVPLAKNRIPFQQAAIYEEEEEEKEDETVSALEEDLEQTEEHQILQTQPLQPTTYSKAHTPRNRNKKQEQEGVYQSGTVANNNKNNNNNNAAGTATAAMMMQMQMHMQQIHMQQMQAAGYPTYGYPPGYVPYPPAGAPYYPPNLSAPMYPYGGHYMSSTPPVSQPQTMDNATNMAAMGLSPPNYPYPMPYPMSYPMMTSANPSAHVAQQTAAAQQNAYYYEQQLAYQQQQAIQLSLAKQSSSNYK
jgi:hypothetical protein